MRLKKKGQMLILGTVGAGDAGLVEDTGLELSNWVPEASARGN